MKPANQRPFDAPASVMRTAGAWLARRDRGFTMAEQAEFNAWRSAHPDHTAAVAQLEQTLSAFDRLKELAPATQGEFTRPDADFFAPTAPRERRKWVPFGLVTLAAAAAIAMLFTRPFVSPDRGYQRYATSTAAEQVVLADGSIVNLNRETELVADFSGRERHLRLARGEAHFDVAKNPVRPFIVAAGNVAARAIGTAFNVRLDEDRVEVLVTAGEVQVAAIRASAAALANPPAQAATDEPVALRPGFRAVVERTGSTAGARVTHLESAEIARQLAWQPRLIELSNATLIEIVAGFNERAAASGHPRLLLGDPTLENLRIGGSIYAEQPEPFVRLLEKSFGIRAERHGDTITLHRVP